MSTPDPADFTSKEIGVQYVPAAIEEDHDDR